MDNAKISVDVLMYWYRSAKRCIERGNPETTECSPRRDSEFQKRLIEGYQMALKTVEQLAWLEDLIEVTPVEEE